MYSQDAARTRRPTCPEHGGALPCPVCAPKEPPPGLFDAIRRDLDAAKTKNAKDASDRRVRAEAKEARDD